jgi:hypothetical protein
MLEFVGQQCQARVTLVEAEGARGVLGESIADGRVGGEPDDFLRPPFLVSASY